MQPKKRDILTTVFFGVLFLVGLSVMLYPTFSNWWNQRHQTRAVASYKEAVAEMDNGETERLLEEARAYNSQLAALYAPFTNFDAIPGYEDILNISGTGIMGYVSIPNINVELPIYHGTSEGVLQIASGHIQGSSLPVGGASTHAVISGHRGLPSAKLFTDLDQIVEGDTFTITTEEPLSTEPMTEDKTDDFLQNGLQFYGSPDTERRKMSAYTQLYEYRTEEPGQPWELIMEYENVPYFGKNCDGVLCFTSLGLVGINYFDSNTSDYNFWVQSLTELYGTPDDMQYDYTAWSSAPVGSGTMIYVFALEDGVQISFFADDTGSELT